MFIKTMYKDRERKLFTVQADASIQDAARLLVTHKIGALLVMAADGEMAGIFSERDLARCIHRHGSEGPTRLVSQFMTPNPLCCSIDDSLDAVMKLMDDNHIRHLPVLEGGVVTAMVSIRDIIGQLMSATADERDALRDYIASATC
jgi:CBS domain-containing protein